MRSYELNQSPESYDDMCAKGARVYDIWNIGKCCILNPSPAILYRRVDHSKHCYVSHSDQSPADFLLAMLNDLTNWPFQFSRDEFMFDMDGLNKKSILNNKKITEMKGLKELSKSLFGLRPPFRQNETTDSVWGLLGISNKTATVSNHKYPGQRHFNLKSHKFDHFCHWMIASYSDCDFKKIAVISSKSVYNSGLKSFSWNESDPEAMKTKNVQLFDLETQAAELREYLETGLRK